MEEGQGRIFRSWSNLQNQVYSILPMLLRENMVLRRLAKHSRISTREKLSAELLLR
ncbi:hypothetical protein OIU79_030412 [Salix purpurea]|uniref:Uncharacterized protein n=1 Tax=Salix purpurea TaxID=77065 RepID=A0A9Q0V8H1_SALPP|nr:hypothetical protein OIU79_030412 [Salix purpurea]